MTYRTLQIPSDSKEILELLSVLKFQAEPNIYRKEMLKSMIEKWGEDLGGDEGGYVDSTIDVIEDGQFVYPFADFSEKKINTYISKKIIDLSLYARSWGYTPDEYEAKIIFNLGTDREQYWVNLNISLDSNFRVAQANVNYDSTQMPHKLITYWSLRQSN